MHCLSTGHCRQVLTRVQLGQTTDASEAKYGGDDELLDWIPRTVGMELPTISCPNGGLLPVISATLLRHHDYPCDPWIQLP